MDKQDLRNAANQINVPKDKVFQAIESGMKKANRVNTTKRKIIYSSIAAASLIGVTLGSGFVNPGMKKVLAAAPLIGQIYQEFGDPLGKDLAKQNMVMKLNQSLTKEGVTVTLTSAYFDGNAVSITGRIEGEIHRGLTEEGEVSFDVNFENHQGDNDPWLNGMSTGFKEKDNGYDFQWKLNFPYKTIKENYSLPISIHYINGIKGDWNFAIPISQKPFKTLSLENSLQHYPDNGVQLEVKEIMVAKASSSLVIETISEYKNDQIDIYKATDHKGKTLFEYRNNSILDQTEENDGYHKTLRKTIDKIDPNLTSITFYPQLSIADPAVEQQLITSSLLLESKRTDLAIQVNNVKQEGDQLIIDYHFLGLPDNPSKDKLGNIIHNLGYAFTLIDQKYVDEIDPENPMPPENHSISRNKVTWKDAYHFQSVFKLNGEEKIKDFKLENTVLRANFNGFIGTEKLAPFTVKLSK